MVLGSAGKVSANPYGLLDAIRKQFVGEFQHLRLVAVRKAEEVGVHPRFHASDARPGVRNGLPIIGIARLDFFQ